VRERTVKEEPTLELVLKRNSVERIKRDKSPLGMLDELPALIGAGYEQVDEEDLVRLKWWGLYHDKPKIGTFMLRIKLAGGIPAGAPARDRRDLERARTRGG
jgi:ferredoxin-nitrite reductase